MRDLHCVVFGYLCPSYQLSHVDPSHLHRHIHYAHTADAVHSPHTSLSAIPTTMNAVVLAQSGTDSNTVCYMNSLLF